MYIHNDWKLYIQMLACCMLVRLAETLDDWVMEQNLAARSEGMLTFRPCTIRVLGQTALFEANVPLTLAATKDVDVLADYEDAVRREFERLLAAEGRELDPLGHEVWMPTETQYTELYSGRFVRLLLADSDAVLVSKALKASAKNRPLLTEYLAKGASDRFLKLASKYAVDLEQFL
jgi:hypothetical protein